MVRGRPATSPLLGLLLIGPCVAHAAPTEPTPTHDDDPPAPEERSAAAPTPRDGDPPTEAPPADAADAPRVIRVGPRHSPLTAPDRAGSVISRDELDRRLPRSAPDALQGEPGVYVQKTSHGQGSPYVRGLTGQQTGMFFDGIRLNNSTFRQGPNQYFFTIDARTIQRLEVQRGSGSTRYGSDALGGTLLSTPVEPTLGPTTPGRPWAVHPRVSTRVTSADAEVGGRGQLELSYRDRLGIIVGAGYRDVGQLRSGGRVLSPSTGQTQKVPPAFEDDDRTQRGTGFRELTSDARIVWQPRPKTRFTVGYYDYRQFDVPRTDRCPPPTAPEDECLRYLQQFRTLTYAAFEGRRLHPAAERLRVTLSYQNQHELRELRRGQPSDTVVNGDDDVHTLGTSLRVDTRDFELARWISLQGHYGTDAYFDLIDSEGWLSFQGVGIRSDLSRGQYLDGGRYLTSGLWGEAVATLFDVLRLRAGGRGALVHARAEGDPTTDSASIDRTWVTAVGSTGLSLQAVPWLSLLANVDQGFRAPNMDDLTSRQQTGPGFQFENPDLTPERSLSTEAGLKVDHPWVELTTWVYQTRIRDLIARGSRTVEQCPMGDMGCGASQTRFQLVNLDGFAYVRGTEADLRVYLPLDLRLRTTISYAWGEGPNPIDSTSADQPDRRPLSRIPPLNGLVEAGWRGGQTGLYAFGTLRWATAQTRLALADLSDARIPEGGTPGYVVVDLRAGYRLDPYLLVALALENVADVAYRHHGSSVNGPGRGISLQLEFGF